MEVANYFQDLTGRRLQRTEIFQNMNNKIISNNNTGGRMHTCTVSTMGVKPPPSSPRPPQTTIQVEGTLPTCPVAAARGSTTRVTTITTTTTNNNNNKASVRNHLTCTLSAVGVTQIGFPSTVRCCSLGHSAR